MSAFSPLRGLPVPCGRLVMAVLLSFALAISARAGRLIESIIIAVLLLPTLGFLVLWTVAWRKGMIEASEN
jgi:hypothetical protein